MTTLKIKIDGMDCLGCTHAIQNAVTAVSGVVSCDVSLDDNEAVIQIDDHADKSKITQTIEDAGFDWQIV